MKPTHTIKECERCSKQVEQITYGKVMWIIDDMRGEARGDKRQVLEDLKDKLRKEFGRGMRNEKDV